VRSSVTQLEFVYHAFTIGETFDKLKLSGAQATQLMSEVGLPSVAARFAGHPYFAIDLGKRRFGRNEVLEDHKLRGYFGKTKAALKKMWENAQRKGTADEDDSEEEEEEEGEEGEGRPARRRKKRTARGIGSTSGSGGGGGSSGSGSSGGGITIVRGERLTRESPLSALTKHVKGFGNVKLAALTASGTWVSVGAFTDDTAAATLKPKGFGGRLTLALLQAALAAHFAAGGECGGGEGAGGDVAAAAEGGEGGGGDGGDDGDDGASEEPRRPPRKRPRFTPPSADEPLAEEMAEEPAVELMEEEEEEEE
jgi:hypothetical protein